MTDNLSESAHDYIKAQSLTNTKTIQSLESLLSKQWLTIVNDTPFLQTDRYKIDFFTTKESKVYIEFILDEEITSIIAKDRNNHTLTEFLGALKPLKQPWINIEIESEWIFADNQRDAEIARKIFSWGKQ